MRRHISFVMLVPVLAACSLAPVAPQVAGSSTPAVPVVAAQASITSSPSPTPDRSPTALPAPTTVVTAPAAPTQTSAPTTAPPAATMASTTAQSNMVAVAWHGVQFSYDRRMYQFSERDAAFWSAQAAAVVWETPDPCVGAHGGSECSGDHLFLMQYPSNGQDVWTWLIQEQTSRWWPGEEWAFDTVLGYRPAVAWYGDGVRAGEITYVVPIGDTMLMLGGRPESWFSGGLQFERAYQTRLEVGHFVMTQPEQDRELWTTPTGGERVEERPRLYGGSFVTILAIEPRAVQVRTIDGVTGWLQAPAAEALTPEVVVTGDQARFTRPNNVPAHVIHRSPIPLRERPRSDAPTVNAAIAADQQLNVVGVRGDWLYVDVLLGGRQRRGWMRWYYDGSIYIDAVPD